MKEAKKEEKIECDLFILQKGDALRMIKRCCKPEVFTGIEACAHKKDERLDRSKDDGSLTCPRAIDAFNLPSLDKRVLGKNK